MSEYREIVKQTFAKHKGLPSKEIMKLAGAEYRKIKGSPKSKSKGGKIPVFNTQASGLFGDLGSTIDGVAGMFGLGLKPKKTRKSCKSKGGSVCGSDDECKAGSMTAGKLKNKVITVENFSNSNGSVQLPRKTGKQKIVAGNIFNDIMGGVGNVLDTASKALPLAAFALPMLM